MGLNPYTNQILNKLNEQPGVEVFNLIDSDGVGKTGLAVYQTRKGAMPNIIELPSKTFKKFSDYSYRAFDGIPKILWELKPDIVVMSESYTDVFVWDKEIIRTVKKLDIKIIRRDIPFRMDKYNEAKRKILDGESDQDYTPFFVFLFRGLCARLGILSLSRKIGKITAQTGLEKLYTRLVGRKVLLKRLELRKQVLNYADAETVYVEEAYNIYGSYGVPRDKIFVTSNSPDTDMLFEIRKKIENEPPILPPNPHRLIHVGRLKEWKRVDMLISSIIDIKKKFSDAELLIIGFGPEENKLKELTKKLDLTESVKFIGGIYEPDELGKYLLSSTVYVLAGMGGLSINDAMAFGKPVILSVCDGTEKKLVYNGRNGLYFKDGDQGDMTDKIITILSDPELVRKMGENSTEIIKNEVNIHTVVNGYMKAFNYLMSKKNG
jgi:glycosyltransferase involved in cell wall biosynthesis